MMTSLHQQGMVLLLTIVMMAIMTLLSLSLMQSTLLSMKVSHQVFKNQDELHQLEAIAYRLAVERVTPNCVMKEHNPNEMIRMVLQDGCELKDHGEDYTYLIDDLGLFSCLQRVLGKNRYSTHHWIITVAKKNTIPEILQLRVAKRVPSLPCEGEVRQLRGFVLSWRYLLG